TKDGFFFMGWYTGYTQNDGKYTTVTPVFKDIVLYAFWQESGADYDFNSKFNEVNIFDEYELLTSEQHAAKIINVYKLGERTCLPLFSTDATPEVYPSCQFTLSMNTTSVTEESIVRGLEIAETEGTSTEGEASIGIDIKGVKLGGKASTAKMTSDTTTSVYSWAKSVSESNGFACTATISPENAKMGRSYRLNVIVNAIYYAYFIRDALSGETISYTTCEFEKDSTGKIVHKFEIEESNADGRFVLEENPIGEIDISSINYTRLNADGFYRDIYIPDSLYAQKEGFDIAHLITNNGLDVGSTKGFSINLEEYFGYSIAELREIEKRTGTSFSIQLFIEYYLTSNTTQPINYWISVENLDSTPIYEVKDNLTIPELAKYHATHFKFVKPLPLSDFEDEFWVIFTLLTRDSKMDLQVGSIGVELKLELNEEKNVTISDTLTAKATSLTDGFSTSNVGAVQLNIKDLFGLTKDNLIYLGYTTLEIDMSYIVSRSKYGAPGFVYLANKLSNTAIKHMDNTYEDTTIVSALAAATSAATSTVTINLSDISSDTLYIIFTSLLSLSGQSGRCTYSNINIILSIVKG
nr:hypothetical protein [Clostridia bacterium]